MFDGHSPTSASGQMQQNAPPDPVPRVVLLINKALEPGVALNAAAHLGMALCNHIGETGRTSLKFLDFCDADKCSHPSISARSLIVLRAASGEIRTLRQRLVDVGLPFVDFNDHMTGGNYEDQLARSATSTESELNYYGLATFGTRETLTPLTRKFSLFK